VDIARGTEDLKKLGNYVGRNEMWQNPFADAKLLTASLTSLVNEPA
jgi:hypothetical protein